MNWLCFPCCSFYDNITVNSVRADDNIFIALGIATNCFKFKKLCNYGFLLEIVGNLALAANTAKYGVLISEWDGLEIVGGFYEQNSFVKKSV